MDNQEPRSRARLALSVVLLAVIGASLIAAAYLRTGQIPISATSTSITTSTSNGVGNTSSTRELSSSSSGQSTPQGLKLGLDVSTNATGALVIATNETNLLDRVNNVTTANDWPYPNTDSLPCGNFNQFPIEWAVLQGHYDASNYSSASALTMYDPGLFYPCPTMTAPLAYLLFAPLSDNASRFYSSGQEDNSFPVSASFSVTGYWTGSGNTAAFHQFLARVYTVLAEDEWGNVALLPFTVDNDTVSTSSSSSAHSGQVILSASNSDWEFQIQLNATAVTIGQTISFTCYLTNTSGQPQTIIVASPLCNGPTIYTQGGEQVWVFEPSATNAVQTISPGQTLFSYQVNIPTI
jgi:hypothetical protein